MEISNFKYIETTGDSLINRKYRATVEVTTSTGFGPWKKKTTEQREVMREYFGFWFFVDTGEFTPHDTVEALARSFSARTGIEL